MSYSHFHDQLANGKIFVSDGAFGTMLLQSGFQTSECLEFLNLSHPELVRSISEEYLKAGADILHTNTFGASPVKLKNYNLENQTEAINRSAVNLIKEIASEGIYISGSCGPSGKILKPFDNVSPDLLFQSFRRQIRVLVESGIDLVTIETMSDIKEAIVAIKAARSISLELPVLATMTFRRTPSGFFSNMGDDLRTSIQRLQDAGADVVGSNCGEGIREMVKLVREMRRFATAPVMIQSNAGLPQLFDGEIIYPETPQLFTEQAGILLDLGVRIIGGCCGTTPDHIRAIRKVVDGAAGNVDIQASP